MILYTVLPIETVLEGLGQERKFVDIQLKGLSLTVEPISMEEAVIVRVISTDPSHYLNPRLAPGRKIRLFQSSSLISDVL
ncbi:MAG: YlzJ-like family protein [Bacillota bacterium]|jgi:hypothetical protein|nr:YlzJ-like family protein [Bacillota bacterium]MDI9415387.1 YlzJ-like family protein [Bacillota bacterium]NLD12380.1 hypothetical protein [Bacillota bacterium]HAV20614.1 hypothetical protein [Bacillota bacterium]HCD41808.1 hypothetical protein [Bacillota bacterium]